jgi:hypothetical protein
MQAVENFLQDEKKAVMAVLRGCVGQANAKTLEKISQESGVNDRRLLEELIEHSLEEFPWPIVSGAKGLWIPQQPEEVTRYYASLRSRIFKMFRRIRTLERKSALAGFCREKLVFVKKERDLFQ